MKKTMSLIGILGFGLMVSGCAAYVRTYDANGKTLGSCSASRNWFFGLGSGAAGCVGSANLKDQK